MAEYIDREALLEDIAEIRAKHGLKEDEEMEFSEADIVGLLLLAPEADVAPVRHGRWMRCREDGVATCSECRNTESEDDAGRFCRYCGALMGGVDHAETR